MCCPKGKEPSKGAMDVETKGVTCKIPLDLHNRISEEIRETESTMSKFIERGIVPAGQGIPGTL